jgi:hypothetical protein
MKPCVLTLALVLGMAVFSASASAEQPNFIRLSPEPDFVIGGACSFPVQVHVVAEDEVLRIFSDGRIAITGTAVRRFTNTVSGESLEFTVSGPEFLTPNPDGTVSVKFVGLHMPVLPPGALGPGSPAIFWITAGPIIAVDAGGPLPASIERLGSTVLHDVCAELG